MSRGGGAGRMGGKDLPFEVDADLENQIAQYRADQVDDEDWLRTLYPEMKVRQPPPPSAWERQRVADYRELRRLRREGSFFIDNPKTGKRNPAEFNAFEDQPTFNNKKQKRSTGLPNLKKTVMLREFLPDELKDLAPSDDEEEEARQTRVQSQMSQIKKKRVDKLARFDEGGDDDAVAADKVDDDEADENEERDEDGIDIPEDDDFSEDEDDLGNDYNAEKYFDDGDGIDDEGGDDGGGEDAW
ncbi:hypothetical protein AC579_9326 [Pseudocercospora musae]|uniref:DNA-directed RNA polymerase III subunit n=1 Tax=Pseudocercospora musae TaxID=113226 RepID=A0A139I4X3_9PEZI|nr:hypothetical protein AC579_9326 [Pseudocercospora musae]